VLDDIKLSSAELARPSKGLDQKYNTSVSLIQKMRIASDSSLSENIPLAWINAVCDFGDGDESITYRPGDVALELLTSTYPQLLKPKDDANNDELEAIPRGAIIYHINDQRERSAHGEIILETLSEHLPGIRSRGTLSDANTPAGKLKFCRDLYMPSLVMELGFLDNKLDRQVLGIIEEDSFNGDQIEKVATALLKAVIKWSDALNPVSWSPD
jgi:hypothetical protein